MPIRNACSNDIPQILSIYAAARAFMHRTGNPTQWPNNYPGLKDIEADIASGDLYVYAKEDEIQAVFFFKRGPDHTYDHIDGAWPNKEPYAVVHRIAAKTGSGAGKRCLAWACGQARNLRIDTHKDNGPMQHVLKAMGFVECGVIICEDGTPRIAYQHTR